MARRGLALAGLALCGTSGVLLALNRFLGDRAVLGEGTSDFIAGHVWFWPVVTALLAATAVLGTCWLLAQGRAVALRRFTLLGGRRKALTNEAVAALTREVMGLPGVHDVRVRFTGTRSRPRVMLQILCHESADLGLLLTRIGEESLVRFREVIEMPDLHAVLRFRLVYQETRIA
ncbi:hypothetical protein ABGB12_24045 [Actinocorallia sp. B10E7]|uniref:hypothetical protein n=1 Tax=Actinocorallia sp. B10E7 TaxID=3153558 RepID=UPI00325F16D1